MKLIEDVGFDQSFSFIYSRRPGTPGGRISPTTRRRGQARAPARGCRRTSTRNAKRYRRGDGRQRAARAGRRPSHASDASELTGRTENMRFVNFAGDPRLIGQFVDVRDHRGDDQFAARAYPDRRRGCRLSHRTPD